MFFTTRARSRVAATARRNAAALALAFGVLAVLGLVHASLPLAFGQALVAGPATRVTSDVEVPETARELLAEIQKRKEEPPPGYVGGRTFGNRERRLPRGKYREYDVNPRKPGKNR